MLLFDEGPGLSVSEELGAGRAGAVSRPPAVTTAASGADLLRAISRARAKLDRRTRVRRGVGVGLLVDPDKWFDPRLRLLATPAGATDLGLLVPAPWVSLVVAVDRPSDGRPVLAYAVRATTVGPAGPAFFPLPVEHGNALAGGFGRDSGRSVVDVVGRLDAALARSAAGRCPAWQRAMVGRYEWNEEAAADVAAPGDWWPVGYAAVPVGHPALAELTFPAVDPARGLATAEVDGPVHLRPSAAAHFRRWVRAGGPVHCPAAGTVVAVHPVYRFGRAGQAVVVRPAAGGPDVAVTVSPRFVADPDRLSVGATVWVGDRLGSDSPPAGVAGRLGRGPVGGLMVHDGDELGFWVRAWRERVGLSLVDGFVHLPTALLVGHGRIPPTDPALGVWVLPPAADGFPAGVGGDVAGYAFPAVDPLPLARAGGRAGVFADATELVLDGDLVISLPPAD